MPPIVASAEVERPATETFAYATDPTRFSEWQKAVVDGHMDADGAPDSRRPVPDHPAHRRSQRPRSARGRDVARQHEWGPGRYVTPVPPDRLRPTR
jgi:hypothetical protein